MSTEWKPDICIYHANCSDGFGAAWAVFERWQYAVEYFPASYGDAPPDVAGKRVLVVDFSYKRPVLDEMSASAHSIVILDHHKTAEKDLAGFNHVVGGSADVANRIFARVAGARQNVLTDFDIEQSGAVLAWKFCHPGREVPLMLRYVEDRDLWRFQLEESRAINAAIASVPQTFDDWGTTRELWFFEGDVPRGLVQVGTAILRQRDKDIGALLDASLRRMTIGGVEVPTANVPFMWASDAGNILAEGNPFAATYFDRSDGTRQFSLRSSPGGLDVSEVAARYGGGGHRNAAGFVAPGGWEGEVGHD